MYDLDNALLDQLASLLSEAEHEASKCNCQQHRMSCYERVYSRFCDIASRVSKGPAMGGGGYEDSMREYLSAHGR
jgi:hypothetical protein